MINLLFFFIVKIISEYSVFHNATALYRSTLESGVAPEPGFRFELLNLGSITVIENPYPDIINPSRYVLRNRIGTTSSSKSRAEYTTQRIKPTNERTLVFTFKQYFPTEFLTGGTIRDYYSSPTQFKTYPCGWYDAPSGSGKDDYSEEMCFSSGIFNAWRCGGQGCSTMQQKYRAKPSCFLTETKLTKGHWFHFVLEIYFTNTMNGYWKSYWNGVLYDEHYNVKTLFDNFPLEEDGTSVCDMYWSAGLYAHQIQLTSDAPDSSELYIDDIAIFDHADGVSAEDLLNQTILDFECNGVSNRDKACNGPFNGICKENGECWCFEGHYGLNCDFECSEVCYGRTYCHGGECICIDGWTGDNCETPICSSCPTNSKCVSPEVCQCNDGYVPPNCEEQGGTECECISENMYCDPENICQCKTGWKGTNCDEPVCDPECQGNSACSLPNTCECLSGWVGQNCSVRDCFGNFAGENCDTCMDGYSGENCTIVSFSSSVGAPTVTVVLIVVLAFAVIALIVVSAVVLLLVVVLLQQKKGKKDNSQEMVEFKS